MTIDDILEQSQRNLIQFLDAELDLARTFHDLALTTKNREHSVILTDKAQEAFETVRHFESRIADQDARARIHTKADDLQRQMKREGLET